MALATATGAAITILADKTAAYSLILAQSGGTAPEANEEVLIYADGTQAFSTPVTVAATSTGTNGQFTTPVTLHPGCVYVVACPNDGTWTNTRFIAPCIVDRVVVSGASL